MAEVQSEQEQTTAQEPSQFSATPHGGSSRLCDTAVPSVHYLPVTIEGFKTAAGAVLKAVRINLNSYARRRRKHK